MHERTTLLVTIDGLRAAALGAYGQTSYETPFFDRLATCGRTYDWCYAETPHSQTLLNRVAAATLRRGSASVVAVTDDPALAGSTDWQAFENRHHCATMRPSRVANEIGQTALAATLADTADFLGEVRSTNLSASLIWLHLLGGYGPWDAPPALFAGMIDGDDPEFACEPIPPATSFADWQSPAACEARFAASCRYAAEVQSLDACLDAFLEAITPLYNDALDLIVAGLRGFPLGEHGSVGGVDPRLYSEQQQTPLIVVRADDHAASYTRSAQPVGVTDTIASLLAVTRPLPSPPDEGLVLESPGVARGMRTRDWYLRTEATLATEAEPTELSDVEEQPLAELYLKPDDRWEHNNIAKLRPDETAELLARLPS
ncbi:hypothetical protein [Botrimarina hoheduenensis]|uniref:Sulfatase n=1 Tax=Botrimarina hoheduenensis TaxID=2528000 RepID=A0A5C5WF80_9BACT|nr:hypothetical protein [Botrimarina hoheduenensis]TWT48749.1 Sulfatase [Botrimarina hoheduenensis]